MGSCYLWVFTSIDVYSCVLSSERWFIKWSLGDGRQKATGVTIVKEMGKEIYVCTGLWMQYISGAPPTGLHSYYKCLWHLSNSSSNVEEHPVQPKLPLAPKWNSFWCEWIGGLGRSSILDKTFETHLRPFLSIAQAFRQNANLWFCVVCVKKPKDLCWDVQR